MDKGQEKKDKPNLILKKCGSISCINNIQGFCSFDTCELYERSLIQEY